MKKKLLGVLLAGAVTASMLTACGGKETTAEPAAATEQQTRQNEGAEEADSASQGTEEKKAEVVEETEEVEEAAESEAIASAETVTELQNLHKKVVELLNVVNDADRSTVITEFEAFFAEFPIEEAMDTVEELGNAIQQENLTEAEAKELKETLETMAESGDQMIGILLATGATIEKVPDDLLVSEGTFDELLEMRMDLGLLLDGMIIAYGETDGSGDFELTEKSYEKMGDLATADQTLREVHETLSRFTPENISETGAVWMIETFSPMIDELNGLLDGE